MKKIIAILFLLINTVVFAQTQTAENIVGRYMTAENKAMVEITNRDGKYYGKFLWTKTEGKLDSNNPVATEKTKPLKGMEFLKSFVFDGKSTWHNGTIYDPENGKTYSCKITRDDKGNLNVRGFIGISLIGRTSYWIKVEK